MKTIMGSKKKVNRHKNPLEIFRNFKIGRKINIAFLLILVIVLIIGVYTIETLNDISASSQDIESEYMKLLVYNSELQKEVQVLNEYILVFNDSLEEEDKENAQNQLGVVKQKIEAVEKL